MLHWLHQKLTNIPVTFKHLAAYSLVLHALVCSMLFFVYTGAPDIGLSISGSRSGVAIVRLLPLGALKPKVGGAVVKSVHTKSLKQKKSAQKKKKKTQIIHEKKQKKELSKKKKKQQETVPEVVSETPVIPEKTPEQKPAELTPKKALEQEVVPEQVKEAESVTISAQQPEQVSSASGDGDQDIMYVTQKELGVLQLQQQLQDAIQQVWTSPIGMAENVVCEVSITVGWDGVLVDITLTKPTGIYIYDRAVQEALESLSFPQQLWGKTIAIAFKP